MNAEQKADTNPCPLCGALPCDWVDDPHKSEVGLCWTLAHIREAMGVYEKPMLQELPAIVAEMAKVLRKIYACHRNGKTTLPQHALDDLTAVLDRMQP